MEPVSQETLPSEIAVQNEVSILLICVGFIVVVHSFAMNISDVDFESEWKNYKKKFKKSYTKKEEKHRKKIWEANFRVSLLIDVSWTWFNFWAG